MNTNSKAISILCYGDSNTWGKIPGEDGRYAANVRWTGVMQDKLGSDFYVIEEGLRSRTTNMDDPTMEGKNGRKYLNPCLESHGPIDTVILMLGTNDLKSVFERSALDVGAGIEELIKLLKTGAWDGQEKPPTIILVCPPLVIEEDLNQPTTFGGAGKKSEEFSAIYQKLAETHGCHYVDTSKLITPEGDGVHLTPESHSKLGLAFANEVKNIYFEATK